MFTENVPPCLPHHFIRIYPYHSRVEVRVYTDKNFFYAREDFYPQNFFHQNERPGSFLVSLTSPYFV